MISTSHLPATYTLESGQPPGRALAKEAVVARFSYYPTFFEHLTRIGNALLESLRVINDPCRPKWPFRSLLILSYADRPTAIFLHSQREVRQSPSLRRHWRHASNSLALRIPRNANDPFHVQRFLFVLVVRPFVKCGLGKIQFCSWVFQR